MVNFPADPRLWLFTVLLFWIYFFFLMLVCVLQWLSCNWEMLTTLLSQFPLSFHQIRSRIPHFVVWLITTLRLRGMVFVIIWEIFYVRISFKSASAVASEFCEWVQVESIIVSIRPSFTYLHGFQLLVLLLQLSLILFVPTEKIFWI